ncbi:MAG: DUF2975 domain-containing protein [Lachnospiraceae bacterium]|nr:DUF2975 domain-containing protein [Lachnospiraceae bacterium]
MNKSLMKVTTVLAKVFEILLWIGDASMIICLIGSAAYGRAISSFIQTGIDDGTITISGFNAQILSQDGSINMFVLRIVFIAGIVTFGFGAMICRNIYQIFKSETPFTKDTVRLVREIGIFAISVPAVQIILSIIIGIASHNKVEVSVDMVTVFMGLVVLSMSQIFQYGVNLQDDVDGLL